MGKRQFTRILDVPSGGTLPALAVLTVSFLLGGLIGCALAASVGGAGSERLSAYIQSYFAASEAGLANPPELLPLIWEVSRWPLMTLILGFTALGVIGVPVLFALRGFLFSFAVSAFVRMFGTSGEILAILIFGFTGLLEIPVLFVLGVQSLSSAWMLTGRALRFRMRVPASGQSYFLRCGICALVLAVCVLLKYIAVPAFLSTVAGRLMV
jgi:hypothetical protein